MKPVYTLRGLLRGSEKRRIIVDDGRFNHAMRVTDFVVFPVSVSGGNDIQCTLGLNKDFQSIWDASDSATFGWASWWSDSNAKHDWKYLDPDHLVVRSLYIRNSSASNAEANYVIKLEPVEISDDEAILQLIKENQQGDPID